MNAVIDILDYDVTKYNDYDLVRITLSIENLAQRTMTEADLHLGGDISTFYSEDSYADVRARGGDVSVDDCTSNGRFNPIPSGATGETTACFMIDKTFEPDALGIIGDVVAVGFLWSQQVIPFHAESTFCFVHSYNHCNANNIQPVDGTPAPEPAPEPEPEPATLLYTIYHNQTGVLTLVFDDLVVAHNPGRIHLIHDIETYIDEGTAPDLGGAELHTVDDKRQSMMLAFTLPEAMHLDVIESLRDNADMALMVDTQAVYAAEGFVDITDGSPMLVPNILVIR